MTEPRTIAIAYASIGSGQRTAAQAIADEMSTIGGSGVRPLPIDIFGARADEGEQEPARRSRPSAIHRLLDRTSGPGLEWSARTIGSPMLAAAHGDFNARLIAEKPVATVSIHPIAALLAAKAAQRESIADSVVGVTPDFGLRGPWPREGLRTLCVTHEAVRESAARLGFDTDRVRITGVPVRRQFMLDYDIAAARRHFGLPESGRIVLILATAEDPSAQQGLADALHVNLPALASLPSASVVVVTGTDTALAASLRSRAHGFANRNVHVLGSEERIAPLMMATDLVIARPDGPVCAECVSVGTPLLLIGPAKGAERLNVTALMEAGAAQYSADPLAMAERARNILSRTPRLESLRLGAAKIARPFAARDIAEHTLGLLP